MQTKQTIRLLAVLSGVVCGLATTIPASAEPSFARQYKAEYGYQPSCNACHKDGGGSPVNGYGELFKDAGSKKASFAEIANKDADGDGFKNGKEIAAKANPGDASSTPKNRGPWLNTANLIPKTVQASFPGITLYKPLDAIYTDSEIKRAAAMGVTLSSDDETTIYLPVKDKRPVGTAIIVPGSHADKSFYLLVATDRKLKISNVVAVKSSKAADLSGIDLNTFNGSSAATIAASNAEQGSLQAAVDNTVKKAITMLLVRLKKA